MCLRGSNECDKLLQSLQASTNFETTTIGKSVKTNYWSALYTLHFLLGIPHYAIW